MTGLRFRLAVLAAVLVVDAAPSIAADETDAGSPVSSSAVQRTLAQVGLDATAIDRTVDPCQDFYHFACGTWLKNTPIPEDKSGWTRSFSEIDKRNEEDLNGILDTARKTAPTDEVDAKIGAFYGSCMNEKSIEKNGLKPIETYLAMARSVKDKPTLLKAIIELHNYRFPILFNISASQDSKDATQMIATLDQDGLGLPDRSYYLDDDDNSRKLRKFYATHVEKMLALAHPKGVTPKAASADVMTLETEIAKISKSKVERRDPIGMYNRVDLDGLKKIAPDFPWDDYFKTLDHPDLKAISVTSIPFFKALNDLLSATKPAVWRSYLTWHVVNSTAQTLPKKIVDEDFKLEAEITGKKKLQERWKRCVEATDGALGELLAQPYIKQKFAGDSKATMEASVAAIRDEFGRNLRGIDWMDAQTRRQAEEKLKGMAFLIGYPDKWKSYDFEVASTDYAGNVLKSRAFELQRDLNKIGKPVDRGEWDMTPPTVNAYYDPQKNQMVFPAGILQPPFFSASSAVAVNMGGIGMVVGHEMTHGFDDEGSQYDAAGNLKNWWTPDVSEQFKAKGKCIVDQYGGYAPLPDVKVNGELTEGENIADNGGVKMAFQAYRRIRADASERVVAEGFTEDQQFFLAVGQAWCTNERDAALRNGVRVDPHSPPMFRVNGSLSNLPEFAEAFSCKAGTPMHPANACRVW
jgi:putative endopeptidase